MNIELLKDIMYPVVGIIYDVRNELGPGLNESVYQATDEILTYNCEQLKTAKKSQPLEGY